MRTMPDTRIKKRVVQISYLIFNLIFHTINDNILRPERAYFCADIHKLEPHPTHARHAAHSAHATHRVAVAVAAAG